MLALLVGVSLMACSTGSDEVSGVDPTEVTTDTPDTTTTQPATTTTDPATTDPTTTAVATTAAPTTAAPTTAVPTTEPPPLAGLVLRDAGLGPSEFGDDPDEVVARIADILGSPTVDTGWVASDSVALCPGDDYRSVEWGVLRLSFGDVSAFGVDRRHFTGWDYGIEGRLGEEPEGLISVNGVGLGTRVDELRDAYPAVEVFDGEEGLFPPAYYVNQHFQGFLTGIEDGDVVTVMFGGERCGG